MDTQIAQVALIRVRFKALFYFYKYTDLNFMLSSKISVDYSLQTGFAVGTLIKTDDSNNNAKRTNNHSDTLNVWSAASSEESFQDWLRRSIEV